MRNTDGVGWIVMPTGAKVEAGGESFAKRTFNQHDFEAVGEYERLLMLRACQN